MISSSSICADESSHGLNNAIKHAKKQLGLNAPRHIYIYIYNTLYIIYIIYIALLFVYIFFICLYIFHICLYVFYISFYSSYFTLVAICCGPHKLT